MASRPTTARDLTREQRNDYKAAFDLFDKDQDGKINSRELGDIMKTLGMDPTQEELKGLEKKCQTLKLCSSKNRISAIF